MGCAGAAAFPVRTAILSGFAEKDRPNILFIMSDDHTTNAISAYGSRLTEISKTPNIDRIASEGMLLKNCFCTNSICVPSRATILTGQYSHVNQVYTLRDVLDPKRQNVAKLLRDSGYQTAVVGKWHLKSIPSGFDYWNVLPGQGRYHDPELTEIGRKKRVHKGFATDIITDLAIKWLKNRNKKKPFFLMTQFKNPHAPWHFADRHASLYRDVKIPEPASLREDLSHRSHGSREYGFRVSGIQVDRMEADNYPTGKLNTNGMNAEAKTGAAYQKYLKDYLRCIQAVDENVGKVLSYLDKEGLNKNTVVIYTSDQGLYLGEHGYIDKRWMYEESLRMPFLIRFPGEIKAGTVTDDIILNSDFAPTFLDYAGENTPDDMQGRSFRTNLAGRSPSNWRESMYYRYWLHCSRPAHLGIRTKRYKLIFFYGLPLNMKGAEKVPTKVGWELYDLKKDPNELHNIYSHPGYAKIVTELKEELKRQRENLGDTDQEYPEMLELIKAYW
ncbi:hypothetical protein BVY01_01865 [bacterium I07]|nr:hypothetical protein BVY01_01865 [bacterium I07]